MKRLLVLTAVAAALATAPSALAATARSAPDTVIAKTKGGVLVANARGTVSLVHANARVGARVVRLGTRLWVVGLARTAHIRGIVVTSRPNMLVLSAAHRLFTVGLAGRRPAAVSANPGSSPHAGDVVGVAVSIDAHGNITATSTEDDGPAGTSQQVQATVTAVGTDTITLDVNGESITLQIPPGITVPAIATGTQITLTLTFSGGDTTATEDDQGDDQSSGDGEDDGVASSTGSTTGSHDGGDDGDSGGGGGD
jgi:hypothetical protein